MSASLLLLREAVPFRLLSFADVPDRHPFQLVAREGDDQVPRLVPLADRTGDHSRLEGGEGVEKEVVLFQVNVLHLLRPVPLHRPPHQEVPLREEEGNSLLLARLARLDRVRPVPYLSAREDEEGDGRHVEGGERGGVGEGGGSEGDAEGEGREGSHVVVHLGPARLEEVVPLLLEARPRHIKPGEGGGGRQVARQERGVVRVYGPLETVGGLRLPSPFRRDADQCRTPP